MTMAEAKLSNFKALQVLWTFRAKVLEGVATDVRHRYAGSVLGLGWSVLFPAMQIAIYTVVYVFIFKVRPAGISQSQYILMVFAGLIPMMAFNEALNNGTGALSNNRSLLTSTVFPPELIPIRAILAAQVPSLVGFMGLLAVTVVAGYMPPGLLLAVPVIWLMMAGFCAGLVWVLSLLSLIARDIQQMLPLIMMALTILSPIAYTPDMVPASLKLILYLNPLSYFVFSFQEIVAFGKLPQGFHIAMSCVLGVGLFLAGFTFFRKAKHIFFDYA
jgi:lipopolysaccharide transport system permease protein